MILFPYVCLFIMQNLLLLVFNTLLYIYALSCRACFKHLFVLFASTLEEMGWFD